MMRIAAALLLLLLGLANAAHAHEVRPAYLQIQQRASGQYSVLWRTPVFSGIMQPSQPVQCGSAPFMNATQLCTGRAGWQARAFLH